MSKLDELIRELCPDGVEYKSIQEIAEVGTGRSNGNEAVESGKFPFFIRSQIIQHKNDYEYDEEAIIIPGEGGIGDIYHYVNGKYALHQRVYRIHFTVPQINTKFAYYYFQSAFKRFILKKAVSATVTSIRKPMITGFEIPVPPLPIQAAIVRILDNFTELTTELTAELAARKKQYEYYRNDMLRLSDTPLVKLSQICKKVSSINWKNCSEEKKYIDLSSVSRDTHSIIAADVSDVSAGNAPSRAKQIISAGDILFGGTRPMLKRYCIVPEIYDNQICSTGFCVLRVNNAIALTNYIYHCLGTNEFFLYVEANQQGASYPAIGDNVLKAYEIPLPPLAEQERIVSILDGFDTLCNDISEGLPAEIEARRKQYEYYRDKLLSFEKKGD